MKNSYNSLTAEAIKASLLGTIAVVSTWLFLFVGMMIIPELGWFVTIDSTINGITIYLMFNFSHKIYLFFCKPFALMCYYCFGGKKAAKQATKDKRFWDTMSPVTKASQSPPRVPPSTELTMAASRSPSIESSTVNPMTGKPISLDITNINIDNGKKHSVGQSQQL